MNKHSAACLVAFTIFNCTAMMCSTAGARENFRSQQSNRPVQAQPQPPAQPNRSFQQPQSNRFGGEQQARAVQEQAVRGQEDQARQFQQAALRQQQDEARRMQQQVPRQQQEQGRMVQQPQQPVSHSINRVVLRGKDLLQFKQLSVQNKQVFRNMAIDRVVQLHLTDQFNHAHLLANLSP